MDKLIITAAITGNITLPVQTPHLPLTPQQIIDDAVRAANAGAASVHIHGRDPKTARPTTEPAVYREIAAGIKAKSNVIVCVTTGGTADMTPAQRAQVVPALKPELATFNMGSINFSIHPIADRYKDEDYKYPWEKDFATGTKDFIFRNTFGDIEKLVQIMTENNTKSEFEVYDVGHLYNINFLVRRKVIKFPIWLQFVTGILGGIGANIEEVVHMKQTADRLFGSENYVWSVIGAGYPAEFNLATLAIMMGGHARVGMEDNIFVEKGVLCKSNADLVEKVVRISKELGREIATPDEARKILGLKGRDKVNY
ncbi:MAG TPA: 3-keto-5-aminohexanoate cleavage protein [Thermodesulfobacteriota bacterium]|nr:3-keto-5-aminohexanoate cleavage protein [Thermodesulfobacteriota bacterium]